MRAMPVGGGGMANNTAIERELRQGLRDHDNCWDSVEEMTMDLRLALYEEAARHGLDAGATRELQRYAGLESEPAGLGALLPRVVMVLAAALCGLGLIFFVAANWNGMGRFTRFALLELLVLAPCSYALWKPAARAPLALLAFLATGGLFAYFGQTYQTGADAWQLFALWAALSLPLCLGARGDLVWAPWVVVAFTAVSLWLHAQALSEWRIYPGDLPVYLAAWAVSLALAIALRPQLHRYTGAGLWAARTALAWCVVLIAGPGLLALSGDTTDPLYWTALAVFAIAGWLLAMPRWFDIFGLCVVALAGNVLLFGGLVRIIFKGERGGLAESLALLAALAGGLLTITVIGVLALTRRHQAAAAEATAIHREAA
jgi:hypothetical protein